MNKDPWVGIKKKDLWEMYEDKSDTNIWLRNEIKKCLAENSMLKEQLSQKEFIQVVYSGSEAYSDMQHKLNLLFTQNMHRLG